MRSAEPWAEVTRQVAHRPWTLPSRPWVMTMSWCDLLFAHWPVPAAALRALVPPALALDTWDGTAWLGIVPFRMSNTGPRAVPRLPWVSEFPELNVRTYVTRDERPGVWFFSLDAASALAVAAARRLFHLPYYRAEMSARAEAGGAGGAGGAIRYSSHRTHPGAPPADFAARYAPSGPPRAPARGTLEHFLTERYCLYAVDRHGRAHRGEVHHAPWPLQPAEAEIELDTMAAAQGIDLPDTPPLLHFARRQDTVAWLPEEIPALPANLVNPVG